MIKELEQKMENIRKFEEEIYIWTSQYDTEHEYIHDPHVRWMVELAEDKVAVIAGMKSIPWLSKTD